MYNLTENSNLYTNTVVGNVSLTPLEISTLAAYSATGVKDITHANNDIFCVECDLGARINISDIKYYFSCLTTSGTVASGINFYYKNESFENFSPLTTIFNGSYYTTVSGVSAPRFVRLIHTVSGTAVSGTIHGFQVFNDDDEVDFGIDGTTTSMTTAGSVFDSTDEVSAIAIYNDSNRLETAYVTLEPQGTNVDDLLTISNNSTGPWIGIKESTQILADENSWNNGNYNDTELNGSNMLILDSPATSGTYTTKIFDNNSKNSFIYMDVYSETNNSFVTRDLNKEVRTIEVRSTNNRPKDYAICRLFYAYDDAPGYEKVYYKDYFRDDGTLIYTSPPFGTQSSTRRINIEVKNAIIDSVTETTFGFLHRAREGYSDDREARVFSITKDGTYTDFTVLRAPLIVNPADLVDDCYYVCPHSAGVWFYVYVDRTSSDGFILNSGAGYYLVHFNSGFVFTYKLFSGDRDIWSISCDYNTGKVWVVDSNNNFVKLIASDGTEEAQYADVNELWGIAAASDGGCWYVSDTDLINLSSAGSYVTTLEDIGSVNLREVMVDDDSNLYIRDGNYVKHITTGGTVNFSVYVVDADRLLQVTDTGVWVRTSTDLIKFVDKNERALKSTSLSYDYYPAAVEYQYDSDTHTDNFPISIDTSWTSLEWQQVRPDKYPLPIGDLYHQARVTLRAGDGATSPIVKGIHNQKSLTVEDIYPGTYENIYLKTSLPNQSLDWVGSYSINLRTWWEVPTNI